MIKILNLIPSAATHEATSEGVGLGYSIWIHQNGNLVFSIENAIPDYHNTPVSMEYIVSLIKLAIEIDYELEWLV